MTAEHVKGHEMKRQFNQGRAVNQIVDLLRKDRDVRPVMLIGAGGSYRAGIPLAEAAVIRIAQEACRRDRFGGRWTADQLKPSDWTRYLEGQPWFIKDPARFAENFPLAVQHLLVPREFRRDFFLRMIKPVNRMNEGYVHLAELMLRGLIHSVLTTNIDTLIADALNMRRPHIRNIVEVNKVDGDLAQFTVYGRNQVAYLHGAVEYYTDRNTEAEISHLKSELVNALRPMLEYSPLIVAGYRGAESSVMNDLLRADTATTKDYKHGIYWCTLPNSILHPNVLRLRDAIGSNFIHLEIEGFDDLFGDVAAELKDEDYYQSGHTRSSRGSIRYGFDEQILEDGTLDDLDLALVLRTLAKYSEGLRRAPVTQDNYLGLLREQGLVHDDNGILRPSVGCFLLFGLDVPRRFPQASVAVTRNGRDRQLFDGSLIGQFQALTEYLDSEELNPLLRVKRATAADERRAYHKRALTEAVVNLLVHRDYAAERFATIDVEPGISLSFENPSRVSERLRRQLNIEPDGSFAPIRGVTDIWNIALADIFFGIGSMDRAGSGLTDVEIYMREHGGSATFAIEAETGCFRTTLLQARQDALASSVARPLSPTGFYSTNLLPFGPIPDALTVFNATRARSIGEPLFAEDESPADLPLFVENANRYISFADFSRWPQFVERRGKTTDIVKMSRDDFVADPDDRRLFVWLVRKYWEFYLRRFIAKGLEREPHRHRAFFKVLEGDRNTIVYDSPKRRGVRRDVVKRRGERYIWHENEGIAYAVVEMDGTWAMQLKPFYMFTGKDGATPLPSFERTARSTRRMKFDRNANVDSDLVFWARFLAEGKAAMQLSCPGVEDLVLSASYLGLEVVEEGGASDARQN